MTQKLFKNYLKGSRVLFIDLSKDFGGASARALSILSKMPSNMGTLATLKNSPVSNQAIKMGIKVYEVSKNKLDPCIIIQLINIIKSDNYNVLDTQNIQSKFWGSLAAWWTKTVLVSTLNSYYEIEHQNSIKGSIYQKLEKITQIFTAQIIVVSSEIKMHLLKNGVQCEDISLIPNAVDADISLIKRENLWLHAKFNIPRDCLISCSIGRMVEAKAFDFLVHSAARIKHTGIHYIIIGEGPLRSNLEDLINSLGMEKQIHLAGFQERETTLKILSSSDFFVISSITEGTPIVLLEAAVLSLPIIATRVGGIPDMVKNNEHALLVESGDEIGLSKAIHKIYSNPFLAQQLAKNVYENTIKNYSLTSQVKATLKVYEKALRLVSKKRF